MKRTFIILITALFLLSVLVSCTTLTYTKQETEDNSGNSPEVTDDSDDSGVIYDASSEVVRISSFDGYTLKGKLTLPGGAKKVSKLVIYVNSLGINTYDDHRNTGETTFNYFDTFAERFSNLGIAFFSYNTRGVDTSNEPRYMPK